MPRGTSDSCVLMNSGICSGLILEQILPHQEPGTDCGFRHGEGRDALPEGHTEATHPPDFDGAPGNGHGQVIRKHNASY